MEERQEKLDNLVSAIAVVQTEQKNIKSDVADIKTDIASVSSDVKDLASKPAKRWDSLVDKVIWLIAGSLIAFFLAQLGLPT